MIEILKFLLLPLLGISGWVLGAAKPRASALLNQWTAYALLALWLLEAAAGVMGGPESFHLNLGHVVVMATWLTAPLAVGAFLHSAVSEEQERSALGAIGAGLSIVAVLMMAVTGYMGPTHAATGARHILRFEFLHFLAAPSLAGGALFLWIAAAREATREGR